jgi:hypothetical protein
VDEDEAEKEQRGRRLLKQNYTAEPRRNTAVAEEAGDVAPPAAARVFRLGANGRGHENPIDQGEGWREARQNKYIPRQRQKWPEPAGRKWRHGGAGILAGARVLATGRRGEGKPGEERMAELRRLEATPKVAGERRSSEQSSSGGVIARTEGNRGGGRVRA